MIRGQDRTYENTLSRLDTAGLPVFRRCRGRARGCPDRRQQKCSCKSFKTTEYFYDMKTQPGEKLPQRSRETLGQFACEYHGGMSHCTSTSLVERFVPLPRSARRLRCDGKCRPRNKDVINAFPARTICPCAMHQYDILYEDALCPNGYTAERGKE
jgi:hypothetical protein